MTKKDGLENAEENTLIDWINTVFRYLRLGKLKFCCCKQEQRNYD